MRESVMNKVMLERQARKVREFRQREAQILQVALELFLAHGEDHVTVEMVADRVGIGKGTIYKHFNSKNEIFLRLMIDYEKDLKGLFSAPEVAQDNEALWRAYFEFRMQSTEKYWLFYRLEEKLLKANVEPQLMEELHQMRASNLESLTDVIRARIDDGVLEDVPPHFHYCAAWAMVHGAAGIKQSKFFQEFIKDQDEFFRFLMDIGVRMGNKGQRRSGRKDTAQDEAD